MKVFFKGLFGKYREIVYITFAFFLIFNLLILGLNFYISLQISSDAISINLSGRQRMLSQRMTKALYGIQISTMGETQVKGDIKELRESSALFDETLSAFVTGGEVTGGAGNRQTLSRASSDEAQATLAEAQTVWKQLRGQIAPLFSTGWTQEQLLAAVDHASANNVRLLTLMNNLTTNLEVEAQARADRLRFIQIGAILLALLAFPVILSRLIRRLRKSDAEAETARRETDDILATAHEGLFLLNADFKIGNQFSKSISSLLNWPVVPGANFDDYLRRNLNAKEFENARDFIELLFLDRILENLIGDVNPLERLAIESQKSGEKSYLSFRFNQVKSEDDTARRLLVTVQDVTEQTVLAMSLDELRKEAGGEISILHSLLDADPRLLKKFVAHTQKSLEYINHSFENLNKGNQSALVGGIFRQVHTLKGEAAMLNLEIFVQAFQSFEDALRRLRESNSAVDGDSLLALVPQLETCFAKVQQVNDLVKRLHKFQSAAQKSATAENRVSADAAEEVGAFVTQASQLANRIAGDEGKRVQLKANLAILPKCDDKQRRHVYNIITQCIRNAVVHGIERPEIRSAAGKPEQGLLEIQLKMDTDGHATLKLHDDGQGIDVDSINRSLIKSGQYRAEELEKYTAKQIIAEIFKPGFSTAKAVGLHAGQGVGLSVVKDCAQALGGVLSLNSRPRQGTTFSVRFRM